MKSASPPRIALSSGEPAGIGPDLCLTLAQAERDWALICLADAELLAQRARALGLTCRLQPYQPDEAICVAPQTLCVAHQPLAAPCTPGQLDVRNAPYVLKLIERAVDGCLSGEFAAMVTAPVQKSIIIESGVAFSGHTEFIAELTAAAHVYNERFDSILPQAVARPVDRRPVCQPSPGWERSIDIQAFRRWSRYRRTR